MSKAIALKPVEMTPELMEELEQRGLIIRLAPGRHELPAAVGENRWEAIYRSAERFGPHMLITVSVNATDILEFGTHGDNEEFLLLGSPAAKPLFLVIALCSQRETEAKAREGRLSAEDFVCLRVAFNDPEVSFFTMRAGVPHGEAVGAGEGRPASFYVAEPRDLETELTDLAGIRLAIEE
ncbi:MAG: hypothetical protein ACE149_19210 [Armatimonadota bacterium]